MESENENEDLLVGYPNIISYESNKNNNRTNGKKYM